jgi:SAM-dependent methyltransferase
MPAYALLVRPAANRVFGGDAAALLTNELRTVDRLGLGGRLGAVATTSIAGVAYVTFESDLVDAATTSVIASLSSSYALFEREGELLRPIDAAPLDRYDDDLVTTQRYVGKTNETFTRLLVNVALAAAGATGRRARILDPLCGRGTTLNHALLLGGDGLGIDVDAKDVQAYATFLKTWLQEKRIKHQLDATAGRRRFRVTIGRKGAAAGDDRQLVDVATADTTEAPALFGKASVDAIATDLPYGVQHGARGGEAATLSRRPGELLRAALPAWRAVLRPGGGLAVSWNVRVLARDELLALVVDGGFELPDLGDDVAFSHRVDRVITRDVVVARRPPGLPRDRDAR